MAKFDETWRKKRKVVDTSLRPGAIMSYRQVVEEKTRELLVRLREDSKGFVAHVELSVGRPPLCRITANGQEAFREEFSCQSHSATT
jgi:hypothetical protein